MIGYRAMSRSVLSKYFARIGRKGGEARAKVLTKKQLHAVAVKASQAAVRARRTSASSLIHSATKS
jgi:hypothetical protein